MQYEAMVEAYKNDPVSFVIDFGKLKNITANGMDFSFDGRFEFTRDLLWLFQRRDKVIVAKKRKQGVSWNLVAFAAWHLFMNPDSKIMFMTFNKTSANATYDRMKFFLEALSNDLEYTLDHPSDHKAFLDIEPPFTLFNGSVFAATSHTNPLGEVPDVVLFDEVQAFSSGNGDMARHLFQIAKKSIMVGTMFNAEEHEHNLTWFDPYVDSMQFVDDFRVVRL